LLSVWGSLKITAPCKGEKAREKNEVKEPKKGGVGGRGKVLRRREKGRRGLFCHGGIRDSQLDDTIQHDLEQPIGIRLEVIQGSFPRGGKKDEERKGRQNEARKEQMRPSLERVFKSYTRWEVYRSQTRGIIEDRTRQGKGGGRNDKRLRRGVTKEMVVF